ncbi:MAG: hypothetical protein U0166_23865 [Acidobacteriota bacterium]
MIGPGGGKDVLAAILSGARRVTAVEINPLVAGLVRDRFATFSGHLYDPHESRPRGRQRPRVRRRGRTGRTTSCRFSIRRHVGREREAEHSLLTENHLYAGGDGLITSRACGRSLLAISWWDVDPPREALRMASVIEAALSREGGDPLTHVAVVRGVRVATFLIGRRPLSPELRSPDRGSRRRASVSRRSSGGEPAAATDLTMPGFRDLGGRGIPSEEPPVGPRSSHPTTGPSSSTRSARATASRRRGTRLRGHARIGDINARASGVVLRLCYLSAAAAIALVLGPLLLARRRLGRMPFGAPIAYFAILGVAFVFVVNGNVGRLSVRFANPAVAFVTLTFATLLGASMGAALSDGLGVNARRIALLAVPAGVLAVGAVLAIPTLRSPLGIGALMAAQGILLGIPFPRGLDRIREGLVPWAFAANGAMSVVGSSLALLVALCFGFRILVFGGAALYAVAALFFPLLGSER